MDRLRRRQVFAAGFPVGGAVLAVDQPVEAHTHDFLELAVLLEGSVASVTRSGTRALEVGSVAVVRPGEWHGYENPAAAVIGNLYLGEELVHAELRWLLEVPGLGRFLLRGGLSLDSLDGVARASVADHLRTLEGPPVPPGSGAAVRAVGAVHGVLGEVARLTLAPQDRPAVSPPVRRMLQLLSRQPAESWTMDRLAADVGHSVSHLHRAFKDQVGITPMAWLTQTRAELAASLLLQTDRPVSWVGRQAGWPDPNYFSRCFRRRYAMSPTAYRERNRGAAVR